MADFKWQTKWNGIILTDEDIFVPCTWNLELDFDIISDVAYHKDIAMQRLEFMIEEKFEGSVFAKFGNELVDIMYPICKSFFICLPDEPYDAILAATTMLKMSAITNEVINIHGCTIQNSLGYKIKNNISIEETVSIIQDVGSEHFMLGMEDPWFLRNDAGFTDILVTDADTESTSLIKDSSTWEKHQLGWSELQDVPASGDLINDIETERWIPFIIKGGANDNDTDKE